MPTAVRTGYGAGGGVSSSLGLRGIGIGEVPDFWSDLNAIVSRMRPRQEFKEPRAPKQARALREARPPARNPEQAVRPALTNQVEARTARSFGTPSMSPQGVLGTFVNPIDVPPELLGVLPTGFFTDTASSNFTYSPTVNPTLYRGPTQRERPR